MSAGAPSCTMRPWSITATRSASESASTWSWVTNKAVTPICRISVDKLAPHAVAQPRVEIGQRLVEQKQARPPHDRARQRNALLLPAGEPRRRAARHGLHPDQREHVHDALLDLRTRDARAAPLRADRRRCRTRRDAARSHRTGTPFRSGARARERSVSASETTRPPIAIEPCSARSRPATQRRIVVLPQPLGPSSA